MDALPDSFLKKIVDGEKPETVENLLVNQQQFKEATDKDQKLRFKDRLTMAYWQLYSEVAQKISPNMPKAKRLFLRFGLLDLKYLSTEDQKLILSQNFDAKDKEDTIFYADEWLLAISQGKIKPSMTDESKKQGKGGGNNDSGIQQKIERVAGTVEAEKNNYRNLLEKRKMMEEAVISIANLLISHPDSPVIDLPDTYTEDQLAKLDEIAETAKQLRKLDRDMITMKNGFISKWEEQQELEKQLDITSGSTVPEVYAVDAQTVDNEVNAIRQMVKMCVGRQGNHFPILASAYLPKETREYNFKQEVEKRILEVERLDPSIFQRTWRQQTNRISPYIVLVPGYGNLGICWEPYDKYNKATSKGRIAVPIFTRTPTISIAMAMGDFRWQTAKELASYHWMDEGLTGRYYEYIQTNKIKGDMKTLFVEDYILWLTKESEGIQKLHKDARYIFWRFVPFPDEMKEQLSMKGYYYDQLWKKEQSFRMSQGY